MSDETTHANPASKTAGMREEVKSIEARLVSPTLDLQTKMELKARKQTLERQIAALEK